jgi:hypothetical protein
MYLKERLTIYCFTTNTKLSDLFVEIVVAVGFSLRYSSFDGYVVISRKLRNLKVAAT